jgi:hypothetical protein
MILTLCLTVVLRIVSDNLRNIDLAGQYSWAVMRAEAELAETGAEELLEESESRGDWEDGYHWRRVVREYLPWEDPDAYQIPVGAYIVTVEVSWTSRGRNRTVSLTTLKLGSGGGTWGPER